MLGKILMNEVNIKFWRSVNPSRAAIKKNSSGFFLSTSLTPRHLLLCVYQHLLRIIFVVRESKDTKFKNQKVSICHNSNHSKEGIKNKIIANTT
jgi:hypothetical protein